MARRRVGWGLRRHSSRHTRRTTGHSRKIFALHKMLQRLGLTKASVNGANGTEGANGEAKREVVSVPPVEEFEQARFLKSFGFGDVVEVRGLAVAVPEGVVVELKQPQSGFVFQKHGDRTLLEEVEALKVEEGDWWYRVVHPAGARFAKIPSLLPQTPRHTIAVPQNTVVHACRRHTPPGSSVTFVELSDNKGWIVESTKEKAVLEQSSDGKYMVENITGHYRDDSEAWYQVVDESGVELLEAPDAGSTRMLELFLPGKAFCVSERFQPPEQGSTFLKVKGREAWVVQRAESDGEEACKKLPPPMDEAVEQWYRVQYPGGVRLRASPAFEHTDPSLGVLVCGWVFLATRRYRAPGSSHMLLQVATPEGVVRDSSSEYGETVDVYGSSSDDSDWDNEDELEQARRGARRHCGWVPSTSNGEEVVVDETLLANTGPHVNAPGSPQQLPPYSVAAAATFLETGDGLEGFVQLAGTGSWVLSRRGQDTKMVRLPAFPRVDKTPRRFVVSAPGGVETVVGPSPSAPRTGQLLPLGAEGSSEMVWSVKGWPGDRGVGDRRFVLLEGMGWVQLDAGTEQEGGPLREIGAPPPPPQPSPFDGTREGAVDEQRQQEENGSSSP
ncbi:hypothetical protein Esi_0031_0133 [Ectocarpus siliculosus]|uniref:Uncharacterized protein n=1 Tax=Ectocarpus siliculosus TaxID=2880 RepID=D8LKZ1_ECTSI|nr:hypothetical protein Esi_0031_0133 [Ectocarpus siliculosus]|eukprot:CBN80124.1 hypothetical protein Esi_0031_0133 [Ectocarpus siliculosus]